MMSTYRVMFIHIYFDSGGISISVDITACGSLLIVFTFSNTRFGPNMSSDTMLLSIVTGKSDS